MSAPRNVDCDRFGWRFSCSWERSGLMAIYMQVAHLGSFNHGAFLKLTPL
jgi:hypothetical protein